MADPAEASEDVATWRHLTQTLSGLAERGRAPGTAASAPDPDRGLPRVAVSMPARNSGRWIGCAVQSVLEQEGVDLALWVVDDASQDDTATVVQGFDDPRLRYLRQPRRRGIGAAHNRVLAESDAPWIAHVDSDDLILPGALRRAVAALQGAAGAGQAYAFHYELDRDLAVSFEEFVRQRRFLRRVHRARRDVRRDLIVHGMVTNPLRTYRRSALEAVGGFREDLAFGVDYEMAVRIAERFDVVAVPEFLYCARVHGGNTQRTLRLRPLRLWWNRVRIVFRLLARGRGRLLGKSGPVVLALLAEGAVDVIGLRRGAKAAAALLLGRRGATA